MCLDAIRNETNLNINTFDDDDDDDDDDEGLRTEL